MSDFDDPLGYPAKKKRGFVAPLIAVVAVAAAGGAGYLAYTQRAEKQKAKSALAQSQQEAQTAKTSATTLEGELGTCKQVRDEETSKRTGAEALVAELEGKLTTAQGEVVDLQKEKAAADAQLAEFKAFTAKFQRMIDAGELEIIFRRGRMIVKLPASVLFASGSADLSEPGKVAIAQVARVLKSVPDRRFLVAGHTDPLPVNNDKFQSNWALSAARAVQVTEALIHSGMAASRISVAGFSSFDPIADNATPMGRQKNRRIEIILEPQLAKPPPGLLKKKTGAKSGKPPAKKGR